MYIVPLSTLIWRYLGYTYLDVSTSTYKRRIKARHSEAEVLLLGDKAIDRVN
jgi:hypothetical protein